MKLATLFGNRYLEDFALSACAERHVELIRFHGIESLLAALNHTSFDAFVFEDESHKLRHWLASLHTRVNYNAPIIVFGEGIAFSISHALLCGANDYATSCAGSSGLLSRIEARISTQIGYKRPVLLQVGAFLLDSQSQCLLSCGTEVCLTSREFSLAWALFENTGRVLTYNALSAQIWGHPGETTKRTIEQHVYKLRRKLSEVIPTCPDVPCIQTVYGVGYRLILSKQDLIPA